MKKSLIFTLGLLCFVNILSSQTSNYDISKYKLPDTERQQLDFKFNLNGSNNYSKQNAPNNNTTDESHGSSFGNTINLNYFGFVNTRKVQIETKSGLYFSMNHDKSSYTGDDSDSKFKNSSLRPRIYYSRTHRKYTDNALFFEYDINTNFGYSNYNHSYNNINYVRTEKQNDLTYSIITPIKYGKGRIEEVQDARQAIYIMDELGKSNSMSNQITEEDITAFADLIATLKDERYFDSRIQTIHELNAVDSFLRAKSLIDQNDITYFATLNDFWMYGRQQIRRSGLRSALVAYPGYGYFNNMNKQTTEVPDPSYQNLTVNTDTKSNIISINTGVEITYEKPTSLATQSATDVSFLFGFLNSSEKDIDGYLKIPNLQMNVEQRFGYYPNTRTSIDLLIGAAALKTFDLIDDENSDDIGLETLSASINTGFDLNYYLSPQLRFNARWELSYYWCDDKDEIIYFNNFEMFNVQNLNSPADFSSSFSTDRFYQSFGISFIYSFF